MKYIYYIILLVLIVSGIIGYVLMPAPATEKKAALIINGKTVTVDEFAS